MEDPSQDNSVRVMGLFKRDPEELVEQYVERVLEYTAEYSQSGWNHTRLIGKPRVYPSYGDNGNAYTTQNGHMEYLLLRFEREVKISSVNIFETYCPGGLVRISAYVGPLPHPAEANLPATPLASTDVPKGVLVPRPAVNQDHPSGLPSLDSKHWKVLWQGANQFQAVAKQSRIFEIDVPSEENIHSKIIRLDIDLRGLASGWYEIDAVLLKGFVKRSPRRPQSQNDGVEFDLAPMVENQAFSDVTIVLDDGRRVPAHRVILACRSEVFRAMLTLGMKEATTGEIRLHDMSYNVLILILRYLYTNFVEIPPDYTIPLYKQADQLQMNSLKQMCVEDFKLCLNADSVIPLFQEVQEHDDLKKVCLDFIVRHYKKVIAGPHIASLPQAMLLEIMRASAEMQ